MTRRYGGSVLSDHLVMVAGMGLNRRSEHWRTVVVPVDLTPAGWRAAHVAAHAVAGVWNDAVAWVRAQWAAGNWSVGVYACKRYLSTLPPLARPLHAHTTQAVAFDLFDAIATFRRNRKAGMKVRAPWRHKNYRPLSFTRGYGWRVNPAGKLSMSLGRARAPIVVNLPSIVDTATGQPVAPGQWGEIRLCWDRDARRWSLHIAIPTIAAPMLDCSKVTAIDEGIINPVTLAAYAPDSTMSSPVIDVTVVNGRHARSIKRRRNKTIAALDRTMSRCADGSRRRKKLVRAKKQAKAAAAAALRNANHHVSRKAAKFVLAHDTGRIVAGDVRGIERNTRRKQRANRSTRQQLSQWDRGKHETLISHKTGVTLEHIDESYSSQTCPACLTRNRPCGRRYRCRGCGFTCHRDAVGAINILMRATHGCYTRIDPNTHVRVTYLRAVRRWSPDQQQTHRKAQRRKARARSNAQNRAAGGAVAGCVAGQNTRSSATVSTTAAPTGEAA